MIAFSRTGGVAVPALELAQLLEEVVLVLAGDLGVGRELAVAVGAVTGRANRLGGLLRLVEVRGLVLGLKAAGDQQKRREQQG
jgi:hypothetical protein